MYAQKIEGDQWVGEKMDAGKIDKMSGAWYNLSYFGVCGSLVPADQQLGQLYELMQAIQKQQKEDEDENT